MTCKNCKKEHPDSCEIIGGKCTCNGLEVEMVEVGKITCIEHTQKGNGHYDFQTAKTLYQCPSCKTIELV